MFKKLVTANGKITPDNPEYRKVYLINSMLVIFATVFGFFTITDFIVGYIIIGLNNFFGFMLSVMLLYSFHKKQNINLISYGVTAIYAYTCFVFISIVGHNFYAYYWLSLFAPIAFFALGIKRGWIFSAIFYGYFFITMIVGLGSFAPSAFTFESVFNIIAATVSLSAMVFYFELSRKEAQKQLKAINETLQERVDKEVAAKIEIERKRETDRAALIQSEKMAQLGNMLGAIIHQWKQPLNAISLNIDDMLFAYRYGELDEKYIIQTANNIKQSIYFMSETADGFRDFYKPSKDKTSFSVLLQILSVKKLLDKQLLQSSIKCTVTGDESIQIVGHDGEFKQVILNILANAKDILEEKKIQNPFIAINVEDSNGSVIIKIEDNGGGIFEQLLPQKLFEMFTSTKGDKGTGIGLALCKTIIEENMNGSIKAYNTKEGACFEIKIPK